MKKTSILGVAAILALVAIIAVAAVPQVAPMIIHGSVTGVSVDSETDIEAYSGSRLCAAGKLAPSEPDPTFTIVVQEPCQVFTLSLNDKVNIQIELETVSGQRFFDWESHKVIFDEFRPIIIVPPRFCIVDADCLVSERCISGICTAV